jgi:hypothetical protein
MSLDDLVRNYNDSVREAVDKHSLVRTKVATLRQNTFVFQVVVLLTLEKKSATSITFLFENLTMDFEFSSPPHTLGHDM